MFRLEFGPLLSYTWRFALGPLRFSLSSIAALPLRLFFILPHGAVFMTTNKVDAPAKPSKVTEPAAPPPQTSLVRLLVLLGILAMVVGAYAYDYLVARPECKKAHDKVQDFVDARNKLGVKESALVTPEEIHKELGMQPTLVEKHPDKQYEVEYYCWWGKVPYLNKRRHFISIVYVGDEPRRFSSHHQEMPPAESLPMSSEPVTDESVTPPPPASASAATSDESSKSSGETKDQVKEPAPGEPAAKDK
jgi:hypothetical protein